MEWAEERVCIRAVDQNSRLRGSTAKTATRARGRQCFGYGKCLLLASSASLTARAPLRHTFSRCQTRFASFFLDLVAWVTRAVTVYRLLMLDAEKWSWVRSPSQSLFSPSYTAMRGVEDKADCMMQARDLPKYFSLFDMIQYTSWAVSAPACRAWIMNAKNKHRDANWRVRKLEVGSEPASRTRRSSLEEAKQGPPHFS